jgi:protocatechuate 3,4-dioxygenase alpha subunit
VEIWQADANGVFAHPLDPRSAEGGSGLLRLGPRAYRSGRGRYQFRTILPDPSREENGAVRCPHINVMVLAVGLTRRLVTTTFFSDTPDPLDDPVWNSVPSATRSRLKVARDESLDRGGVPAYRFDIVLRGENETPFFLD